MLLGGAIAFGIVIISLASGFTSGMDVAVQNNVTLFSAGHVLVSGIAASETGRAQNRISDASLAQAAKEILPEAVSISETAQSQATVVFGSREQQLRVRGVDWATDRLFSQNLILTSGDWTAAKADRAIILGAQSARRFGLGLGDSVFVKLSTVSGQQNVMEYKLGAVYDDSAAGGMTTALVPLADLLSDLNMKPGQYQSLAVFLPDASQADSAAAKLTIGLKKAGYSMLDASALAAANRQSLAGNQSAGGQTTNSQTAGPQGGTVSGQTAAQNNGASSITAQAIATKRAARRQALAGNSSTTSTTVGPVPSDAGGPMAGLSGPGGNAGNPGGGFGRSFMSQIFANVPAGTTFYRVATVTELSGQMGAVLGSVRWISITIFAIMLVLVAAGITNTYRMVLMERTKEIGMLRCIGFKRSDIFWIFIFEAGLIAIAGSLAGIVVSLPIGLLVHLVPFNPSGSLGSALSRGRLTFAPQLLSLAFICLAVIAASVFAVLGPARKAARLLPVEAMRTTA
jgi:ABC-type lipoprotein release transport system permease subunit